MRRYKVVITGFALGQLDSCPLTVLREVISTAQMLEHTPKMFEVEASYPERRYRKFHVGRYRVFFRVDDEDSAVYILWIQSASARVPPASDLQASEET